MLPLSVIHFLGGNIIHIPLAGLLLPPLVDLNLWPSRCRHIWLAKFLLFDIDNDISVTVHNLTRLSHGEDVDSITVDVLR